MNESQLVINGEVKQYPKAFYQFAAIRECWKRAKKSELRTFMIEELTNSMNEIVENYEIEQELLKEVA